MPRKQENTAAGMGWEHQGTGGARGPAACELQTHWGLFQNKKLMEVAG